MKEYTIVVECSLIDTITRNEEVESIIASDIYKNLLKGLLKAKNNIDDVDITNVKVFVRDLDSEESEE